MHARLLEPLVVHSDIIYKTLHTGHFFPAAQSQGAVVKAYFPAEHQHGVANAIDVQPSLFAFEHQFHVGPTALGDEAYTVKALFVLPFSLDTDVQAARLLMQLNR